MLKHYKIPPQLIDSLQNKYAYVRFTIDCSRRSVLVAYIPLPVESLPQNTVGVFLVMLCFTITLAVNCLGVLIYVHYRTLIYFWAYPVCLNP